MEKTRDSKKPKKLSEQSCLCLLRLYGCMHTWQLKGSRLESCLIYQLLLKNLVIQVRKDPSVQQCKCAKCATIKNQHSVGFASLCSLSVVMLNKNPV